jgi:hypothetical protein
MGRMVTTMSNTASMTTDMGRSKLIGVRLDEKELKRLERLRQHFAAKYPPPPGGSAEMSVSATVKIALTLVEQYELGEKAPEPEPSRPRMKKATARKR